MITCPECGATADDGAKFCDRCGRGLEPKAAQPPPASRPLPLEPGTTLKHGFEVIELLGQTSLENRYRVRRAIGASGETLVLRERLGPESAAETAADESIEGASPAPVRAENPAGPTAKTAELRLPRANPVQSSESAETAATGAGGEATLEAASEDARPAEQAASAPASAEQAPAASAGAVANGDLQAASEAPEENSAQAAVEEPAPAEDLGEVFGRVFALSAILNHPAFQRAQEGFAEDGRVYLVYADQALQPVVPEGRKLAEADAIADAIQLCQAISFAHRRGLRLNDICPQSVALGADRRIKVTGLDYVSNDNELQTEPVFNDGYTAPEICRSRPVDKRADIFSAGALLYTWLTGERIESESWREEAGPIRFYPPHVVAPDLEQAIRRALLFEPKDRWATIDAFKAELIKLAAAFRVRAAVLTDVGMVRELNEDSAMAVEYTRDSLVDPAHNYLYVVADGMGGAEAGETASAIAVSAVRRYVESGLGSADAADPCKLMIAALEQANLKILEYQAAHPESRGMGSTGVAALIVPPQAAVAWVGDSRAYVLANGALTQVTRDHSLVQRLVEIGQITAEEARHHEHKNVITRSLGARRDASAGAEAVAFRLKRGDRMLLCSDGLMAHVDDREIGEILRRHSDPYEAARELVCAANAGGGTDNVSVIVVFAS
ncbi:MAG TPA: Stp1/IreP family PP2C-type Ser/Thr phosphatase [Candidatus Binataceae bacterium]|nr:Stp1/IreP family PP2C-type Ser/Thr phosphatase [Candidatus Binataceae bacterium]